MFNWFSKQTPKIICHDDNYFSPGDKVVELEQRIKVLEEKYSNALLDIQRLEEENIETSNVLYELMNNIDAVDNRIDILANTPKPYKEFN